MSVNICLKCKHDPWWQEAVPGSHVYQAWCPWAATHLARIKSELWIWCQGREQGQFRACKGFTQR